MNEDQFDSREFRNPVLRGLLGMSTFYKILIANSSLVLVGSTAGIWLYGSASHMPWGLPATVILLAVASASILINAGLLRLALSPIDHLSKTMNQVAQGNLQLRAKPHPLSEEKVSLCTQSLNQMLDKLEQTLASLEKANERSRQHTKQVIAAQEAERKRIARGLHDETNQVLTSLSFGLEKLRLEMPQEFSQCSACKNGVSTLKGLTDKALIELHRVAFNLRPALLDDMGLKAALSALLRENVEKQGIRVEFLWEGTEERFPGEIEIAIFRLIQEAMTNAVKYANAKMVSVVLRPGPAQVDVEILDDGIGFDMEAVQRNKENGLGLRGMEERVSLLQGLFSLQSAAGKGTRIAAAIPINRELTASK